MVEPLRAYSSAPSAPYGALRAGVHRDVPPNRWKSEFLSITVSSPEHLARVAGTMPEAERILRHVGSGRA